MTLALDEMREFNSMIETRPDSIRYDINQCKQCGIRDGGHLLGCTLGTIQGAPPISPAQSAYEKPVEDWCKNPQKDPLEVMKDYLLLKFEQGDWHGVSDAAMDIREMLAKEKK